VVAKVRERLAVKEQSSHRCHMNKFNNNNLNKAKGKGQYHVEVSNRYAALEDMDGDVDINSGWEIIRGNIEISAKESLG
jgi:hypothetical protein